MSLRVNRIHGPVTLGAGFNLTLGCDLPITADDAVFESHFLKIGRLPGVGHARTLERAIGRAQATWLLLFIQPIGAAEAPTMGLIGQVRGSKRQISAACGLAGRSADLPREPFLASKASFRQAASQCDAASVEHEMAGRHRSLSQAPFKDLVSRLKTALPAR